ncbi:MAG TPA: YfhO family protein [Pirellulales bacterium]|nr:YfhO family protein [Pirellulales bacterium]
MSQDASKGTVVLFSRLVPVALCIVCTAPFVGLLASGDSIVSDPARDFGSLHLPLAEFAREELLAGRLPLWNPYVGCGQPLHAAQQASLCYPLAMPLVVACGANWGLKLSLFAHLLICFSGAYCLARRLNISYLSAAFGAMVLTWSGALMGHLAEGHVSMVYQSALVPWFFLVLTNLLARPGPIAAARLVAMGSLCALADHPQVLYYTFIGCALVTTWSLCMGQAASHRGRVIGWVAVAGMAVALIAAVQLVPAIELLSDGLRESGRGSSRFGGTYALDGADAARMLMPFLNGSPFAQVLQFDGSDHYHERVVYLGLAAPVLAAYGLSRAATARWQWAAAWSIVLALGVAFGDSTPAFAVLGRALPGLSLFRCPGRVFCIASLPAALLAAKGLDAVSHGDARAAGAAWTRFVALLLAGAGIIAYAAMSHAPAFDGDRYVQYLRTHLTNDLVLWAILAVELAAVFALSTIWRLRGWIISVSIIYVAAFDLGYFNVRNFRMGNRESFSVKLPPADSMARSVDAPNFPHIIFDGLRYSRWVRATIVGRRLSVATYDGGVLPSATARLYKAIEADSPPTLALAACAFLWSANEGKYERLPVALPRLRFVGVNDAAIVDALIEDVPYRNLDRMRKCEPGTVRVIDDLPTRMAIDVDAPTAGRLVLADTWYRGWKATVDGDEAAIDRAHGVFRSVSVPGGSHRVVFVYEPVSFRLGVIGSALGVVLWSGLLAFGICRHRAERCLG